MISTTSSLGNGSAPRAIAPAALNPATVHDAELVSRFNAGDEGAFVEIVSRYRARMFTVALSMLRNHTDAEEIASDVFVRAYRGLVRFRGDSSLATWLHRIAFNLSRNRYWYSKRCKRNETHSLDCALGVDNNTTFADVIAVDVPDPAQTLANQEFFADVATCMGRLDGPQRHILTLRTGLDRSYEEIAGTLGLRLGTVKSRIARARKNLRTLLSELYAEIADDPAVAGPKPTGPKAGSVGALIGRSVGAFSRP